ncbi:Beta-barrel assembly machine subunit BamE [Limimonas halophila]|uniref:Beta-barrel assembly machine subunit BamE n=1 Tax=Limimonas halophila TaxID=1082479 RepID=A0A1G7NVB8_9PROT|nr:outer membrane protein assembly factor BamE [Limimonas halophila]SDF77962.1 Beta-barrel assembly machine subunit BamE [Limimonas halophila]
MVQRGRTARVVAWALVAGTALAAAGCEAPKRVHGNMPEKDEIAKIRAGKDTRNDVVDVLGAPSTRAPFANETWYYIGAEKKQIAFFEPEVVTRRVFKVSFRDDNTVADTKVLTKTDGRAIDPVDDITPTAGRDLNVFEQLIGNLGRFNQSGSSGGASPGPGRGPTTPRPQ